jgi:valyl-tRNA synthetase
MLDQANYYFEKLEFGEAAKLIYNFTWHDFASWYIEMAKLSTTNQTKVVLIYVLDKIIKLLHPFMPFVTEEIFQKLPNKEISIMVSNWPENNGLVFDEVIDTDWFFELIKKIRTIRNDYQVPWSKPIDMLIQTNQRNKAFLLDNERYFKKFLNPNKFEISESIENTENSVTVILPNVQAYIPLGSLVNIEEEIQKVTKEIKRLESEIKRCSGMLRNENFLGKAPAEKIEEEKQKLAKYQDNLKEAKNRLVELKE